MPLAARTLNPVSQASRGICLPDESVETISQPYSRLFLSFLDSGNSAQRNPSGSPLENS